jgi:hypothetical protein
VRIRFIDRTNTDIDKLAQISWEARASHSGEYFQIPPRTEAELTELINDEEDREVEAAVDEVEDNLPNRETPRIDLSKFSGSQPFEAREAPNKPIVSRLIVAVDSGVVDLGEFVGGGIAFAIRGAAVCLIEDEVTVLTYGTGPILIDEENQVPVFSYVGERLGKEDLYITRTEDGQLVPRPSAFDTGNQVRDRCRNFVERMIHEEALGLMVGNQRGLLLVDGALPAGTYDTPQSYLEDMLYSAANNKIDIAAVSKKSRIAVQGKPVSAMFDDQPAFVGYARLMEALTRERERYVEQGIAREAS